MTENSTDDISTGPALSSIFRAAACACALPMIIGTIGLYFSSGISGVGWGLLNDPLFGLPVWLCFTFGTPLVAWLSCRTLALKSSEANTNLSRFREIWKFHEIWPIALKYSFYVHALGFLTCVAFLTLVSGTDWMAILGYSLFLGGIINLILFAIVTTPLSLFCTAIFARLYPTPHTKPAL